LAPTPDDEKRISRRRLLKSALLFSAVGAGVVLLGGAARAAPSAAPASKSFLQSSPSTSAESTTSSASSSLQTPSAGPTATSSGSSVRVKASYFQMPLVVDVKEEYFVLHTPAYFGDLLAQVVQRHPSVSRMIPTMLILIDGVPASKSAPLRDGDEVDFIPAVAGG